MRTTTVQVAALADWLAGFGVTRVGMEATGVYWKPVLYGLEDRFECWLLNAQHLRNVPGRKTDVADSAWICRLVAHGLVRPSFVPPPPIRQLRDLTRYRKAQIDRAYAVGAAVRQGGPRRWHQADQCGLDHAGRISPVDAPGADRR